MALSLQIRQTQKQVVSPAMMMELSLLQLPIGDLREEVKKEVESNPALEVERPPLASATRARERGAGADKEGFLENVADLRGETLDEHLMGELRMGGVEGRALEVARAIVEGLDGDGRLTASFADLTMVLHGRGVEHVSDAELEAARQRVMATDPQGCGARDLAECYRAQIPSLPKEQRALAETAVDYVANALQKKAVPAGEAPSPQAIALLKKLVPFPGRLYDRVQTVAVVPDIFVNEAGEVRVDQSDVPTLKVSPRYVEMAKDPDVDAETRAYAAERVRRARAFREAVLRRQETMEKIAASVMAHQREFLTSGLPALRKLTMSEVARDVHCTVSTVSRAAARKYVRTSHGTVPLRKFFSLVNQGPIERLREIYESFKGQARPSDETVARLMREAGHPMARRTVAKYRVKLGIF